jgi:YhcN/YlaJ family sporulation lipoprotein
MKSLVIAVFIALLAAGCGKTSNQGAAPAPNAGSDRQLKAQQTIPPKPNITNPQEVAAHLESIAERIPRVNDAHCVVFGNTAVVGINVDKNLDQATVGTVKYSVAEALRKDPYGIHAIVTADMDLDQRLREIRDEIINGRPIAGFAQEMADIIGRIMPQLPQDVRPANPSPDHPRDQVPKGNL